MQTFLLDDVHSIILQYLTFRDTFSFQQVCKQCWDTSATQVTKINLLPHAYQKVYRSTPGFLKVISRRFPNTTELYFSGYKVDIPTLSNFPKLELFGFDPSTPHSFTYLEWLEVIKIMPNYRGLSLAYNHIQFPVYYKVDVPQTLQLKNITHLVLDDTYHPSIVYEALPVVAKTVTHLQILVSKPRDDFLLVLEALVDNLPECSNLETIICSTVLSIKLCEKLFQKSPKLHTYMGGLNKESAPILDKYCPNLTKLGYFEDVSETLDVPNTWFKNVKLFNSRRDAPIVVGAQKKIQFCESVQLDTLDGVADYHDYKKNLVNATKLYVAVWSDHDLYLVVTFKNAVEVKVSDHTRKSELQMLVDALPKLRYIRGSNKKITTGKRNTNGEVIEASVMRKVTRPKKKAKLTK